ncbi:hypothetical protein Hanom_Chr12g01074341 [Helianthus anomalus]
MDSLYFLNQEQSTLTLPIILYFKHPLQKHSNKKNKKTQSTQESSTQGGSRPLLWVLRTHSV